MLVASTDDEIFKREELVPAMRDNLLVEFGMLACAVGYKRVFFVCPSELELPFPSDLAGIVHAKYDTDRVARSPSDRAAAVQAPCQQIRDVIDDEWQGIKGLGVKILFMTFLLHTVFKLSKTDRIN